MNKTWIVYLVRCVDNSLYAGITTDINRRLHEHNTSVKGAKYTCTKRPVTVVYTENASCRSSASKREYQLKKLTKIKKEKLVSEFQVNTTNNDATG